MPLQLRRTSEGVIRSVDDHPGIIVVAPTDDGISWAVQSRIDPVPLRDAARARGEASMQACLIDRDPSVEHCLSIEEFVGAISDPVTLVTATLMLAEIAATFPRHALRLRRFDLAHAVIAYLEETERQLGERGVELIAEALQ